MTQLVLKLLLFAALLIPATSLADVDAGDTPSYTATTLDGESLTAAELRGKVVLIDFWATWCAPCKESFPFYSELAKEHGDDLVVLAVSVDAEREAIEQFLKGKDYAFSVVWSKKHSLAKKFGPSTFPTSYLIDRTGKVRHVHVGFDAKAKKKTAEQLEALIGE